MFAGMLSISYVLAFSFFFRREINDVIPTAGKKLSAC